MIRSNTTHGWRLIRHQDHARLAGEIARCWGNDQFARPQPDAEILTAVARHDDAWAKRDAAPLLAPDKRPAAFSSELVGTYSAFENIDLAEYLGVRGAATEAVAAESPLSAVFISMHTVNLLTEQADLSGLSPAQFALHANFIAEQRKRQAELLGSLPANERPSDEQLLRAFEFLQACDSCSLIACVQFREPTALRHYHPDAAGVRQTIRCLPTGPTSFQLTPYPLNAPLVRLKVPSRCLFGFKFESEDDLLTAWKHGTDESLEFTFHQ